MSQKLGVCLSSWRIQPYQEELGTPEPLLLTSAPRLPRVSPWHTWRLREPRITAFTGRYRARSSISWPKASKREGSHEQVPGRGRPGVCQLAFTREGRMCSLQGALCERGSTACYAWSPDVPGLTQPARGPAPLPPSSCSLHTSQGVGSSCRPHGRPAALHGAGIP